MHPIKRPREWRDVRSACHGPRTVLHWDRDLLLVAPIAEQRVRNAFVFRTGLIPARGLRGALPAGIASLFVGLASLSSGAVSEWLMRVAFIFVILMLLAVAFAPNWIKPRSARRERADFSAIPYGHEPEEGVDSPRSLARSHLATKVTGAWPRGIQT